MKLQWFVHPERVYIPGIKTRQIHICNDEDVDHFIPHQILPRPFPLHPTGDIGIVVLVITQCEPCAKLPVVVRHRH